MPISMAAPVWRSVTATVAVLAALAFLNGLSGEFVLDDRPFLVDNPKLSQPHSPAWFFRENVWYYSNLQGAFSSSYRPLFFLTLWSLEGIGAGGPLALHCFGLLLHVLASVLLLRLLRRMMPETSALAAGFGAALFAVHPVHSEAIAWIAAFPHALATVFWLNFKVRCRPCHRLDRGLPPCPVDRVPVGLLPVLPELPAHRHAPELRHCNHILLPGPVE